jgi:hypothetical protein
MTDGGHQAYANLYPAYVWPTGGGMWVPTPPANSNPMLPYWGSNRAFVASNGASFPMPPAPPAYSTDINSPMYQSALQVYNTANNLTAAQQTIASYWADGGGTFTPPGHLMAIVSQLVQQKNYKLDKAAKMFCQAGMALYDASIVCWKCKYTYNTQRPITYIRANVPGASSWTSFIGTPPFPSYTSGHSTFSKATSTVLEAVLGTHFPFTDQSKVPYGFTARSFYNIHAAADEAATSRLYGGIHYAHDNNEGKTCGDMVAQHVLALNWLP